jgi:hypothetical protein
MILCVPFAGAEERAGTGVVCFVKVLSDKVEDVSSLEAWKSSFIRDGMTDEQKAMAVWNTVVRFQHQDPPPHEYLMGDDDNVHDPIKTFNVYGYGMCCCASCNIESLGRYVGIQARGWAATHHSIPELFYNNGWHMLDSSGILYFLKDDNSVAGVEELTANPDELCKVSRIHPSPLPDGRSLTTDHNFNKISEVYRKNGNRPYLYEYGYSQGYQLNIQLRPGERITRNWSNKGLHVNMLEGKGPPGSLAGKTGVYPLLETPQFGDIAPGRIGNGTHEYDVPLGSGAFRGTALACDNLACHIDDQKSPALHLKDDKQPGTLILRMPSSYVYLGGELSFKAVVGAGGEIDFEFSDNNGLDWKDLAKVTESGEKKIDLKQLVFRRYDYRVRLKLSGAGTGLDALKFTHDIQHSQRALPALGQGQNTITFSAGPAESTVTVEARCGTDNKGKQLTYNDFHPKLNNVAPELFALSGGQGDVTFPITTPAEMTRLRFGCHYRARSEKDGWDYQVSFDSGKNFKTVEHAEGPYNGHCKYVTFSEIPPGTKEALIRFAGTQINAVCMFGFHIDADYKQPSGGFRPVKITYTWDEKGESKQDVHIATKEHDTYNINCAAKPDLKAIVLELAE